MDFSGIREFWPLFVFSTKLQWILYVWRAWECLRRVRFISWPEENQFNGCHGPSINLSAQCRKCQTEVQSDDPLWFYCWSGDPHNASSHGQSEPENSATESSESYMAFQRSKCVHSAFSPFSLSLPTRSAYPLRISPRFYFKEHHPNPDWLTKPRTAVN